MNLQLIKLETGLKNFLLFYLITVTVGIILGLVFLSATSEYSLTGTVEHIRGSETGGDFDIPEKYPKAAADLLITTHNHVMGFAFLILSVGLIFYFNTTIKGFWKYLIMVEPLFSSIITFGSIWLVRFAHPGFIWLAAISSALLYLSVFIMIGICIYELKLKKLPAVKPCYSDNTVD
jgi:hypothetical protein